MAPREYTLKYSPRLLRSAAISFMRRFIDLWFLISLVGLGLFAAYLLSVGNHSWFAGAAAGVFLVVTAIMLALLGAHIGRARTTARALSGGPVKLTLSEQGLGFQSILGSADIPWENLSAAYIEEHFILILFKRGGYTSLPLSDLDAEALAYIKQRIGAVGGEND